MRNGLYRSACIGPRNQSNLLEYGYSIGGAEDHGATVSVYLSDPDGNGIEL